MGGGRNCIQNVEYSIVIYGERDRYANRSIGNIKRLRPKSDGSASADLDREEHPGNGRLDSRKKLREGGGEGTPRRGLHSRRKGVKGDRLIHFGKGKWQGVISARGTKKLWKKENPSFWRARRDGGGEYSRYAKTASKKEKSINREAKNSRKKEEEADRSKVTLRKRIGRNPSSNDGKKKVLSVPFSLKVFSPWAGGRINSPQVSCTEGKRRLVRKVFSYVGVHLLGKALEGE